MAGNAQTNTASRPLKVFLTCFKGDIENVRTKLYEPLKSESGIEIWFYDEDLLPGHNKKVEASKNIGKSDIAIICWSSAGYNDNYEEENDPANDHIKLILDAVGEKRLETNFIVPVKLEECEEYESLRHLVHAELYRHPREYSKILKMLKFRANQLKINLEIDYERIIRAS